MCPKYMTSLLKEVILWIFMAIGAGLSSDVGPNGKRVTFRPLEQVFVCIQLYIS
jgi:hypothetical protein